VPELWRAGTRAIAEGRLRVQLIGHVDAVLNAAFSPDGTRVVTASYDKTVRVWDAPSGALLRSNSYTGSTAPSQNPDLYADGAAYINPFRPYRCAPRMETLTGAPQFFCAGIGG